MRLSTISLAAVLALTAGCNGSSEGVIISSMGNEDQLTGDIDNQDESASGVILMYSGATFVSTENPVSSIVKFTADEVFWTQSDTIDSGSYLDNGETNLTATFAFGDIPFSDAGGDIIWNSVKHRRAAGSQFDSRENLVAFLDNATYRSVELLQGGERADGSVGTINWSMWFEDDKVFWATRDTIAVGTYSYVDGSTFNVSFGNSIMPVTMLHNDQIVIQGSVYEKDFSNQFDSQETLTGFLDGESYESVGLRQIGPVVDGVAALGRWRVDFSNDTFQWFYEDVAEAGTVAYLNNTGFTAVFNDRELTIEVDGNDIIWDSVRYSKVAK